MYYVLRHGVCLNYLYGDTINQRVTNPTCARAAREPNSQRARKSNARARCTVTVQRASKSNARALRARNHGPRQHTKLTVEATLRIPKGLLLVNPQLRPLFAFLGLLQHLTHQDDPQVSS